MNWKKFLTNPFRKKKMPTSLGRPPEIKPIPALMTPEDAVKTVPEELIKDLKNYKSVVGGNPGKFNEEQQLELMEFIARYATIDEINAYFVPKYKLSVSYPLMTQYKKTAKWKPVIKKLREKYLIGTEEVAISHKRVRLDRAERASQMAMLKNDANGILNANRDAREEVVGKNSGTSIGSINMQFNGMTYEEIQDYKREVLEKLNRTVQPKEITNGPDRTPEQNKE